MIWRVHEIIKHLQARPFQSAGQLARAIEGVSTKTILRDLKFIQEEFDLPLKYHEKKHGYHFTGPVSEFAPMQLTKGELVALFVAEKAVEPLKGTRLHKLVHDSLHKIAEACPEFVSLKWQDLDEAFSMKTNGVLKSSVEVFTTLMDAVLGQREITFGYPPKKGGALERRRVLPYHVGQLQNGWYLIAHDLVRQDWRTFALQRMSDLKILKTRFPRDPAFNIRDYLGSGFGVWSYGNEVERFEVCIRFTGWAARYVAERQWHSSQSITPINADSSEIEFRAEVAGLEEITRWVLGHGRHARVLAPEKLRDAVHAEAQAMLEK
jgi:predicted DNA-binding transcriptional regulator YafY